MTKKNGYNRRDFLKILGASTGMAAAGCGRDVPEKIIPYVVQPDETIPGVATWYAGDCSECSAGCGILVRTREGRAVKVEGNPNHPVNKGGLCAQGQSSLQSLYDPDRIREPLYREAGSGPFKPTDWKTAVENIGKSLKTLPAGKEAVLLTRPLSGSITTLIESLSKAIPGFKHVTFDTSGNDVLAVAAERSFGSGKRVDFDFSKADVVFSVGAGYLESWVSPAKFSRQWASRRSPGKLGGLSECIHVEPRLSLTAANADRWIQNAPGTENAILIALLADVMSQGGKRLEASQRGFVEQLLSAHDVAAAKKIAGSSVKGIAEKLWAARTSLVVAGGASVSGPQAVEAAMLANVLNTVLGNVGRTLTLSTVSTPATLGHQNMLGLIKSIEAGKVAFLVVNGVNPAYSLSAKSGFREAVAKVGRVISLGTNIDETASLAHYVLPESSRFESWGDAEPEPGVFSLNQPSMQPLYQSESLGDTLIAVAAVAGANIGNESTFHDYLQTQWESRGGKSAWLRHVEHGGDWLNKLPGSSGALVGSVATLRVALSKPADEPQVLAFPTINSFDGRSANRPWMQELPSPITTAVWGSWAEVHPERAKTLGVKTGDVLQVRTDSGGIEIPAYVTKHVHPSLIAIPIGQGHKTMGRYADGIGANVLALMAPKSASGATPLLAAITASRKAMGKDELVTTQQYKDQLDRAILRTVSEKKLKESTASGHGEHEKAAHGHHDPHALGPQDPAPQMYKQMEHVDYKWGMSVDLAACTGCSACVVACYAENNIPVVGRQFVAEGREMAWLRIEHYLEEDNDEQPVTGFQPMMCQHCGNAPCEPVCPVYATYHNEEGLNAMVYNRCVGTRYCANNCSYKVRRFNWFHYTYPEPLNWQLNPDVTVREVGVMEKCSFCVQRIRDGKNTAKNEGREVRDGEVQPACASSCPTQAIKFGNLNDKESRVYHDTQDARSYLVLDSHINTQPAVTYLAKVTHGEKQKSGGHH